MTNSIAATLVSLIFIKQASQTLLWALVLLCLLPKMLLPPVPVWLPPSSPPSICSNGIISVKPTLTNVLMIITGNASPHTPMPFTLPYFFFHQLLNTVHFNYSLCLLLFPILAIHTVKHMKTETFLCFVHCCIQTCGTVLNIIDVC